MPAGSGMASSPLTLRRLRPVLALQVDDQVTRLDVLHGRADRGDTADALGARRRRQRRLQPVAAAAEPHVRRVDREGQHVEHDLVGGRFADIGHVGAARDVPRRSIAVDLAPASCRASRRFTGALLARRLLIW